MSLKIINSFICSSELTEELRADKYQEVIDCPKELDISNIKGIPNVFSYKYQHQAKGILVNSNLENSFGVSLKGKRNFGLEGLEIREERNVFFAKLDWNIRINPAFLIKGVPFISHKEIQRNFEMAGIQFEAKNIGCAYPVGKYNLTIDVACNHFHNYYDGNSAPADYIFPMPQHFWVIKDATFRFRCDLGKEALEEAIQQYGFGKQGSTYGHFTLL